jgi:hypothetical protein
MVPPVGIRFYPDLTSLSYLMNGSFTRQLLTRLMILKHPAMGNGAATAAPEEETVMAAL